MIVDVSHRVWLTMAMHALWPSYDTHKLASVAALAVEVEGETGIPAELLVAIAQHESDFEARAVSYVAGGTRRDVVLRDDQAPSRGTVYGYLQAMCTDATCARELDRDGAMRAGAAEIVEWLDTCHGDIACAMRGHAGGTRCALDARTCKREWLSFASIFIGRAAELSRLEDSTSTGEIR